ENTPGAEQTTMKDSEGTIRQDSETGRKVRSAAEGAGTGAVIGAVTNGGIGGGAGLAVGMLSRGADVRLGPGTSIEMEIQREVTVDASRISSRREVIV